MFKLKIASTEIHENSFTTRAGNPAISRVQHGLLDINGEVRIYPVRRQHGEPALNPGNYFLCCDNMLTVGRYGLELKPFTDPLIKPV